MSIVQQQQLYKLQHNADFIKSKKTLESSKAFEARVAMLEAKTDNSSNRSIFGDEKPKVNNRNNSTLDRKRSSTRQSQVDS